MRFMWVAAFVGLAFATPALAKDTAACKPGLICASDPQTLIAEMQAQGYKAKLETDETGDPSISSASNGYNYDIYFYGCAEHKQCDSIQFQIVFSKDPANTLALANKWNLGHRFGQMSLRDTGSLSVTQDVTTIGGLDKENFDDVVDWWTSVLGDLQKFFDKELPPAKK